MNKSCSMMFSKEIVSVVTGEKASNGSLLSVGVRRRCRHKNHHTYDRLYKQRHPERYEVVKAEGAELFMEAVLAIVINMALG